MKLNLEYRVPTQYERLNWAEIIRAITQQVNDLSEGKIRANHNAQETVPSGTTASQHAPGDQVRDSNATVQASIAPGLSASYVRFGWIKTGDGQFHEVRMFTGD